MSSPRETPAPPVFPAIGAPHPELSVVMPVYNEEDVIAAVVREWEEELGRLAIDYELLVYDDGSRDGTAQIVHTLLPGIPRLRLRRHENRGHGPTVLRGYREAGGEWIFQTDSDGEMRAASFAALWRLRQEHDFLLGSRQGRRVSSARWIVSRLSALVVRLLFGGRLHDVNCPFRLMRRQPLTEMLPRVPDDCFAPNVILTGLAVKAGLRIVEVPVSYEGRRSGAVSLHGSKLWRAAVRALRQTGGVAWRARWTRS